MHLSKAIGEQQFLVVSSQQKALRGRFLRMSLKRLAGQLLLELKRFRLKQI